MFTSVMLGVALSAAVYLGQISPQAEVLFGPAAQGAVATDQTGTGQAPSAPLAPVLSNAGMECSQGISALPGINGEVPQGWQAVLLNGQPLITSSRIHFAGHCGADGWVEYLEGVDSWGMLAQDMEETAEPGKPFDAALYQRVQTVKDTAYAVSGWLVSFCGGSKSDPNDCPAGYYISKMIGIDPTGGTDPRAASVSWVEDHRNFTEAKWVNLHLAVTAQGGYMTIFVRVRSPYRHHGNHALIDSISVQGAPAAGFAALPAQADQPLNVQWQGNLGPDVPNIPGGTHQLTYDLEWRRDADLTWHPWLSRQPAGNAFFNDGSRTAASYRFRVRPLAEQPDDSHGVFPNHRYDGVWTESPAVVLMPVNGPPNIAWPGDRVSQAGEAVTLNLWANDPNGDAITFSATGLPPGLAITPASGCITGNLGQAFGSYPVTIRASDGDLSGSVDFIWLVVADVWRTALPIGLHN